MKIELSATEITLLIGCINVGVDYEMTLAEQADNTMSLTHHKHRATLINKLRNSVVEQLRPSNHPCAPQLVEIS